MAEIVEPKVEKATLEVLVGEFRVQKEELDHVRSELASLAGSARTGRGCRFRQRLGLFLGKQHQPDRFGLGPDRGLVHARPISINRWVDNGGAGRHQGIIEDGLRCRLTAS